VADLAQAEPAQAEPQPVIEPVAAVETAPPAPVEPDPAEITTPPSAPRRGWWRR
jgi:ribonuclease E